MLIDLPYRIFCMKKVLLLGFLAVFICCAKRENPLLGLWKVDSKYYRAICEIVEEKNEIKGIVLYYNDDTTIYKHEEGRPNNYFFNNIKNIDDGYVDAISGATITKGKEEAVTLNLLGHDTLIVTTFVMHKPLKETWIRQ